MSKAETKSKWEWKEIDWKTAEHKTFKLQKRIYSASKSGNVKLTRKLQKLLVKSLYARLIAVRKVTQENRGKNTAGVDGVKSLNPKQRMELVERLRIDSKSSPTRRIWISKPGKEEKRPLGIPTIEDRAKQALLKQALEPEWEAKFEPNSYGFRPGRSTHDAIKAIRASIQAKPKYILDADITKCCDKIDHGKLLEKIDTFPTFKRQIKAWLKSGVIYNGFPEQTTAGTPQGGVISPLLANIALHGMEQALEERFPGRKDGNIARCEKTYGKKISIPRLIRYADDFVIINEELEIVVECGKIIEERLKEIGLEINSRKTKIVNTLHEFNGEKPGFDFLGCNIRQYHEGKHKSKRLKSKNWEKLKPFSTLVKPADESIKRHYDQIAKIIHKHKASSQEALIKELTPVIKGWCNYYSYHNSRKTFNKLDYLTFKRLWRWACRQHRMKKSAGWTKNRYWHTIGKSTWNFAYKNKDNEVIKLLHHRETKASEKYTKVKGEASPYNGEDSYWMNRLGEKYKTLDKQKARLIKKQKGRCQKCGLTFKPGDIFEKHHITPKKENGNNSDNNLEILHLHCHDQIHGSI